MDTEKRLSWPAYVGAGFSFVPLLGVLLGLVFLGFGIFTRRSGGKLVAAVGAGGLLFNVALYGTLFYKMNHPTGEMAESMVRLAAEHTLPDVLRKIEYFKLVNGRYPERLAQLEPQYVAPPSFGAVGTIFYRVAADGKTYCLLMPGLDGSAFTEDDIYPKTEPSEASKIGFRRCDR